MVRGEEDHVLLLHQEEPDEGNAALGVHGGNAASQQGAGAEAPGDVELQEQQRTTLPAQFSMSSSSPMALSGYQPVALENSAGTAEWQVVSLIRRRA